MEGEKDWSHRQTQTQTFTDTQRHTQPRGGYTFIIPDHPIPTGLLRNQIRVYHYPKIGINTNLSGPNFGKVVWYTTPKSVSIPVLRQPIMDKRT